LSFWEAGIFPSLGFSSSVDPAAVKKKLRYSKAFFITAYTAIAYFGASLWKAALKGQTPEIEICEM
jgi:hypothetical protein